MPSLRDQLAAKRDTMTEEVRHAYEAMVTALRRTDFLSRALRVGDRFPDLVLPNAEGALVSIDRLLAEGPLVATFFRGEWCPYCRLMLNALAASLPQIRALGATLVAITPEAGGRALTAKRNHNAAFEVLCDIDSGVGLTCGVVFQTPEPYRLLLLKYDTDLAERHGNPSWFLPVPATFVVDRDGIVRWRFISVDFTERAEPADILAALRALPRPEG